MKRALIIITLALLAAHLGCSKVDEAAHRQEASGVLKRLADAGIKLKDAAPLDAAPFSAAACERARVGELVLTACSFAGDVDESGAEKRAEKMEDLLGEEADTVVARALGGVVVAIADPGGADPNGKAIAHILAALDPAKP
jgi:hypothetical protein